jgi:hypothetical protein
MRILIEKEVPLINVDSDVLEMLDEGNIHYRSEPDGTTTIVEQKVNLLEEDMNDTLLYILHWHTNCRVTLRMYCYGKYKLDLQEIVS